MTSLKPLSAAAILSMMFATPVFAQAAVQEPGAYAFYHPDGDVLEAGVSRPHEPAGAFASMPVGDSGAYAAMAAPTIRNQARFLVTMEPVIPACKAVQTTTKKGGRTGRPFL
jgi:hypothetical protein